MKKHIFPIFISLIFLAAIYIALYPHIMFEKASINEIDTIKTYMDDIQNRSKEEKEKILEEAREYNKMIENKWKISLFMYQGSEYSDEEYDNLLNIEDGVMCYIDVPSQGIYLPVTHGTKSEDLDGMAGHMYLSSLPVGGEGTNAIIAAHTGLSTARLFSDLDKVEKGEYFYIRVMDEVLCYQVVDIFICTPAEDYHYLQIEEGKDYVSLYTCTPYGINDHRLIIRGEHREELDEVIEEKVEDSTLNVEKKNETALKKFYILAFSPAIAWGCFVLIYTTVCVIKSVRNKKNKRTE